MKKVESGHFTLSPEQRQFKEMLSAYPKFIKYWDFDQRDCDLESIDRVFGSLSRTEQIMLSFFVGVWLHHNKLELDFTNIAAFLDKENLQVILDWLSDPVWP